jgi:hypothetical protein
LNHAKLAGSVENAAAFSGDGIPRDVVGLGCQIGAFIEVRTHGLTGSSFKGGKEAANESIGNPVEDFPSVIGSVDT